MCQDEVVNMAPSCRGSWRRMMSCSSARCQISCRAFTVVGVANFINFEFLVFSLLKIIKCPKIDIQPYLWYILLIKMANFARICSLQAYLRQVV